MTKRREEMCLTVKELADRMNCSRSYIGRLENGRQIPSYRFLTRLFKVLGKFSIPDEWNFCTECGRQRDDT